MAHLSTSQTIVETPLHWHLSGCAHSHYVIPERSTAWMCRSRDAKWSKNEDFTVNACILLMWIAKYRRQLSVFVRESSGRYPNCCSTTKNEALKCRAWEINESPRKTDTSSITDREDPPRGKTRGSHSKCSWSALHACKSSQPIFKAASGAIFHPSNVANFCGFRIPSLSRDQSGENTSSLFPYQMSHMQKRNFLRCLISGWGWTRGGINFWWINEAIIDDRKN